MQTKGASIIWPKGQRCLDFCTAVPGASVHRVLWRYLDEVACDVPSGDVQPAGQVGQREALVHRTDVGDPVTRVHHHAGQQA